ncbi:DUF1642 domain-containing protein [Lacticaseibacillus paracasei]|uniref:DUF1642 domain-containing protein n=1 Tax=Lacticaseibacillus paracasei TaxID=1597 RepID=UPI0003439CDC|nr:DUF1642 domain-containing protein [Lacticaseibacillus paracasei]EPC99927.1 phage protein [Lacticaseibacillus paracasei subsp. paracasei Lpp125]
MSEEKLYAVKNGDGKYFDCEYAKFLPLSESYCPVMVSEDNAKAFANDYGGHVVTLIEVPEKVVISKTNALRQGWLVARYGRYNPDAVSDILARYKDETWDMIEAYVNGYTVAKEKKYNVKVPHTKDVWYYKESEAYLQTICPADKKLRGNFTEAEIEHYGLQDCEKEEVTDDDD